MTTTLERVRTRVRRAAYARTMAMPIEREHHHGFPVTVTDVVDVTPHYRRLTLAAPQLREYRTLGPDEYFGLVMPQPGQELPDLSRLAGSNLRGALGELPEVERPDLRWYTVRRHRPEAGEVDVEVVTHGDDGPGSSWVRRAQAGQLAGFQTGSSCYRLGSAAGDQVLVADETAFPALCGILEQAGPGVRPHVFLEVPGPGVLPDLTPLAAGLAGTVAVVDRGDRAPGQAVTETLAAADLPAPTFAWACGEKELAASVRRHLVSERGMDKRRVYFCGYWILGRPRG
ncbi:siderophore-interacting protein [Ornithinicoccus halotolerans]|uniref:siderophore-interacting protein n=1 Tax=Ornithinicoccus halotolerans TaxID=1748220 RepID=UPI0012971F27|nr:siderophore-interacting protein [Ornithinicoccus halotolerans]